MGSLVRGSQFQQDHSVMRVHDLLCVILLFFDRESTSLSGRKASRHAFCGMPPLLWSVDLSGMHCFRWRNHRTGDAPRLMPDREVRASGTGCARIKNYAGVAKSGQRRWIQGPVSQEFVGSNPIPRIPAYRFLFFDRFVYFFSTLRPTFSFHGCHLGSFTPDAVMCRYFVETGFTQTARQ